MLGIRSFNIIPKRINHFIHTLRPCSIRVNKKDAPYSLSVFFIDRGDVNGDRATDLSDPIAILLYLFAQKAIPCIEAADANKDREIDISDAIYILDYLFGGSRQEPEGIVYCP